ncbi:MAG: hypothetical protein AB1650_00635 [Candidatus Omnitrophota bacterium]
MHPDPEIIFVFRRSFFVLRFLCIQGLVSCIFFSGCSTVKKIQHFSELMTLKRYSEAQDAISRDVEMQDRLFNELRQEIETGKFNYSNAKCVKKRFGVPVFKRIKEYKGQAAEQWLYRYAKDFKGDRVYMYFDGTGKLIDLEYMKISGGQPQNEE